MLKYWFRDCGSEVRVWLDGWAGDMFSRFSPEQFKNLQLEVNKLNQHFQEKSLGVPILFSEWTKED